MLTVKYPVTVSGAVQHFDWISNQNQNWMVKMASWKRISVTSVVIITPDCITQPAATPAVVPLDTAVE